VNAAHRAAMGSALTAALEYAALGFAVFPCVYQTKRPARGHSFQSATTNPATIRRWFGGTHPYNIAVRTGLMSGVWVLDVDDRHGGFATLDQLVRRYSQLPPTRECRTANGIHKWWRATSPIQNSDDRVGPGLGVKGDNAGIMVPPSVHPDGPIYTWANDEPLAEAPDWLVVLTRKRPITSNSSRARAARANSTGRLNRYGAAALDREIKALVSAQPGFRNCALNRASFSLHQLVAGGVLDAGLVERELLAAAEANGLMADPNDGPHRVMATIRSGASAGLQHPRGRP
jgi:hypothetical protein